jgi:hypothetical protein
MLRHLFRPFSYLFIEHRQKWIIDWIYPLILAVISTVAVLFVQRYGSVSLYAEGGLISKILGFVQNLPGFYIAALAAIATFNRVDIDRTMPAPAPRIDIVVQGKKVPIELTRRRFLCSMFAFLTAENLVIVAMAIFAQALCGAVKAKVGGCYHLWLSGTFLFVFLLLFWQMMITTFWGLFYLGDKLHQPD